MGQDSRGDKKEKKWKTIYSQFNLFPNELIEFQKMSRVHLRIRKATCLLELFWRA